MSYIEREALLEEIQEELDFESTMYTEEQNKYITLGLKIAQNDIKRRPAADVVPVVRCGNCRYFQSDDNKRPVFCTNPNIAVVELCRPQRLSCPLMPRDGFCSKGEKKNNAKKV